MIFNFMLPHLESTVSLLPLLAMLSDPAYANERRFTYTYDTLTLPAGARELEPWTTVLFPAEDGAGIVMKQRVELEWGISDRLMSAFYLNWESDTGGSGFTGVASEWKLGLLSRAIDPLGLALYGEAAVGPEESSVEAKLLLDKEAGSWLFAWNLVGELEYTRIATAATAAEWERETVLANRLGLSWKHGPGALGVELLEDTEFHDGAVEVKLAAGPALSWAADGWWAAASAPVHFVEIAEGATEIEAELQVRLLLGFDF